ncbi:unnamed protein product [Trifolium pratense]|uniref:Uncharacterized protein n=1 Tax=Trifolium pratense TaxID=57577 RepID=A0ACB0KP47_TRIPR|nr:unnamed protein product [Trifolium pratense]
MAGKVAPGGVERFRRRHNAEGLMEYWLESADLVDIRRLKEPIMSESSTPQTLTSTTENIVEKTTEKKNWNNNKETKSADTQKLGSTAVEDRAAKIERLKSSFRICKPRGTFKWPNMSMSPHVVANLDEHTMVLTPGSASSSTTAPLKLISKSQTPNLPFFSC